jgi:hypothetical protein
VTWGSSNPVVGAVDATGSLLALAAGNVTVTATINGQNGTAPVVVEALPPPPSGGGGGGGGASYPMQPAGYTKIAETDDGKLPWNGVLSGSTLLGASSPSRLLTIAPTPYTFPNGQTLAQKFIFEAGTQPGYQEAGSDFASYYLWDGLTFDGAFGPAANEYSSFYQSTWFSIYGNGTNMELPAAGGFKLYYLGSTYNNLNSSGGFDQLILWLRGVTPTAHSGTPDTYTEFYVDLLTQNFTAMAARQNLNMSTHVKVGQVHHLETVMTMGTDKNPNGTVDAWLDGVHVLSANNIPILNSTTTYAGAPGNAGFTSYVFAPWWGGGGGPNKSRDDIIYFGHTYLSGVFLRAHQ